jgi:hypothetical protein
MALVVEDGTARADAESYCSVAAADTYHANRGNTVWAALTQTVKEQCLRKATDYMVVYRNAWDGYRKTTTQALDWPRFMVPIKDNFLLYGFGQIYYDDSQRARPACRTLRGTRAEGGRWHRVGAGSRPGGAAREGRPDRDGLCAGRAQTTRFYAVENMLQPYLAGGASSRKVSRA